MQKVGNFSQEHVKQLRADLKTLYDKVKAQKGDCDKDAMIEVCHYLSVVDNRLSFCMAGLAACQPIVIPDTARLLQEAHRIGDEYLALEKFVNLNYMVCLL